MKTYKNLYPQIYPFANLYQSYRAARKGKRDRPAVAIFEFDLEQSPIFHMVPDRDKNEKPTKRVHELWQTDFTQFKVIDWG